MSKYILLAIIVFMATIALYSSESGDYKIISMTEDNIVVDFSLPDYKIEKVNKNGEIYDKIKISTDAISVADPGAPILPYFSKAVGLPPEGSLSYVILDKETKVKRDVNILPSDKPVPNGENLDYIFYKDDRIYSKNQIYPDKIITLSSSAYIGDRDFATFYIHPFRFNPIKKELSVITHIKVKISISGDKNVDRSWQESSNYIDQWGDDFFINNNFSKMWRKSKEKSDYVAPKNANDITSIQLVVDSEGIYKITKNYLIESINQYMEENEIDLNVAFDWDHLDPRNLELYDKNGSVPIRFVGETDGHFDDGDYFEFYGDIHHGETSYYGHYTSRNTYVLKLIDHLGSRLIVENGGLVETNADHYTIPSSFYTTEHFEKQYIMESLSLRENAGFFREDVYFWDKINAPAMKDYVFTLHNPDKDHSFKKYTAKIVLWGITDFEGITTDHYGIVSLNTDLIDQHYWDGQSERVFQSAEASPNTGLLNGDNHLYLNFPGVQGVNTEVNALDYFEVNYWREYKAYDDYLKFSKPEDKPYGVFQFEIENFTSDSISVYKLGASYFENLQIEPLQETNNSLFKLAFQDSVVSPNVEYIAVSEVQKKTPYKIRPDVPSNLKDPSNSADYVIIAPELFARQDAINGFVDLWDGLGHKVKIVQLEDIFDEFNGGIRGAKPIKDFLKYAYNNWNQPQLTHVLLLGDGLDDERDNSPNEDINFIPFYPIWSKDRGYFASDNWYACIVGSDMAPDISIARIPIWQKEQVEYVAEKSKHYMENPSYEDMWHSRILLAAGGKADETNNGFADQEEDIKEGFIPICYDTSRLYTKVGDYPQSYHGTTADLINDINDGTFFIQFIGHGSTGVWSDYSLFGGADVDVLSNSKYPLFSSLSCYGAVFSNAQDNGISEKLINSPNRGAIGFIGLTGFGYVTSDMVLGRAMADGLFQKNIKNVGDLSNYIKVKALSNFLTHNNNNAIYALVGGFEYLGDPMINLTYPQKRNEVTLDKYNLAPSDTLIMNANIQNNILEGKFILYSSDDVQLPLSQYFPNSHPAIDGVVSASDYVIPDTLTLYSGVVKFFGYSDEKEFMGSTNYTVGISAINNLEIAPKFPTSRDSVYIKADFFDLDGIEKVVCINDYLDHSLIHEMTKISDFTYRTTKPFIPQNTTTIPYHFEITDLNGNITTTEEYSYNINEVKYILSDIHLAEYQNNLAISLMVRNDGDIDAPPTDLKLYDISSSKNELLLAVVKTDTLHVLENKWENILLPILNKQIKFRVIVNESEATFDGTGQIDSDYYNINIFKVGDGDITATSLDGYMECFFPQDAVSDSGLFYVNQFDNEEGGEFEPLNQPDLKKIMMPSNQDESAYSTVYEISALNKNILADTLGTFTNGKRVTLRFHYNSHDSQTQQDENSGDFSVYKWNSDFKKWMFMSRGAIPQNDEIVYQANRTGIYSIFMNDDKIVPSIEANVEGQEFSHGGFVSKNGIVSFLLSDANGIDIFNSDILLELNGNVIDSNDYTLSFSQGHLTHIPMKYQLHGLSKGDYNFTLTCTDINGNTKSTDIPFKVNDSFDLINVGNYPNPVVTHTTNPNNEGNTRFTYVLTDDADDVKITIYTVSGRLVKTFDKLSTTIGYHEYPRTLKGWDCRDESGRFLANGTYFYKIVAKRGKKKVEKIMKMAILK